MTEGRRLHRRVGEVLGEPTLRWILLDPLAKVERRAARVGDRDGLGRAVGNVVETQAPTTRGLAHRELDEVPGSDVEELLGVEVDRVVAPEDAVHGGAVRFV